MIKAGVIVAWLLLWQLTAAIVDSEFLFPSPISVIKRLSELAVTADFWKAAAYSLGRISLGCAGGIIVGTLFGALTAFSKPLYEFFSPLLVTVKTTPVASFIILLLVWVKRSGIPIVIAFLMVVPILWSNVAEGLRNADRQLLEAAKIFRFTRMQKIKGVYIPSVRPSFTAGCTTAIGFSWKAGIAAEILAIPPDTVGYNLYYAKINLEYDDLFAWTAAVIAMSFLLEKAVVKILKK
ncbi:MAG: ABC transporter permease subunit [Clostridia bacterium]|nr:ABC transporter permease subunit [Clostridia bacterium]